MKLLTRDIGHCQLQFTTQEKDLLLSLLPQYPKIPTDYHQASKTGAASEEAQQLLADALKENRENNRAVAQQLLTDTARFEADGEDWRLTLTIAEVEGLLQVLNDLRVGSWLALGSPEQGKDGNYIDIENLNAQNIEDLMTMEICGALQYELLNVLHPET